MSGRVDGLRPLTHPPGPTCPGVVVPVVSFFPRIAVPPGLHRLSGSTDVHGEPAAISPATAPTSTAMKKNTSDGESCEGSGSRGGPKIKRALSRPLSTAPRRAPGQPMSAGSTSANTSASHKSHMHLDDPRLTIIGSSAHPVTFPARCGPVPSCWAAGRLIPVLPTNPSGLTRAVCVNECR